MHKVLEILIDLRRIDEKLLALERERGDLPSKVEMLERETEAAGEQLRQKNEILAAHRSETTALERTIEEAAQCLEKYKKQLFQVKTNKEYDAISNEIDAAQEVKFNAEFRREELKELIEAAEAEVVRLTERYNDLERQLAECRNELEARKAMTKEREDELLKQRDDLVAHIPKPILNSYERIRQARNGVAVAFLRSGACSECSTRIPPQRGMEIRMMNRLHLCEVCGRILVWKPEESGQ